MIGEALLLAAAGLAQPDSLRVPNGTAQVVSAGDADFGVFSPLRVGITDTTQLSTTPLTAWFFPHLDVQHAWRSTNSLVLSTRTRLSYPTLLLETFSREGTLGLLPADSDVPAMVGFDLEFLATQRVAPSQFVTSSIQVSLAPRLQDGDFPVLDFPFLFSRFAQTKAPFAAHYRVAISGALGSRFSYFGDISYSVLPLASQLAFSAEQSLAVTWHFAQGWALDVGERVSVAELPVGLRLHYLPVLDLRLAF